MVPNVDRVTALIAETAAQEVMPRFRMLEAHEVQEKSAGELVTVVDVAVEKRLTAALSELLPGSLVVGEEAVAAAPELLDELAAHESYAWIIDPVDGTGNFAKGREPFAVMVALVRGAEALAGWIHDPCSGRTAAGELGGGTFIDGTRQAVSGTREVAEMRGTLHANQYGPPELKSRVQAAKETLNPLKSLHCAGHEYLRMIAGETDYSLFTRTKPWDHVAGVLLHQEAGGYDRLLDGKSYLPSDYAASGLLLAPSEEGWHALRDAVVGEWKAA